MIKLLKKYWTHILNILLFIFLIIIFSWNSLLLSDEINLIGGIILIIELILVIAIWIEIIYYIIYIAKSKDIPNRGIKALLIYMLCYWYIPCFKLKYINKDKNYKIKNIIYLIISIILSILAIFIMLRFSLGEITGNSDTYKTYISNDNIVEVTLPSSYRKRNVGQYDLYFSKGTTVNIGMFLYNDYGYNAYDILEIQENYLLDSRNNMKLKYSGKVYDYSKDINLITYEGSYKNTNNIYSLATITFDSIDDYVIYVIIIHEINSYDREEVEKILCDIDLVY